MLANKLACAQPSNKRVAGILWMRMKHVKNIYSEEVWSRRRLEAHERDPV